jgi:hypothetical protein
MWTSDDTVVTTTSITTVSVSMRNAQSTDSVPDENQLSTWTRSASLSPKPTVKNAIHERRAEMTRSPDVMTSAAREPAAAGSWSCPSASSCSSSGSWAWECAARPRCDGSSAAPEVRCQAP